MDRVKVTKLGRKLCEDKVEKADPEEGGGRAVMERAKSVCECCGEEPVCEEAPEGYPYCRECSYETHCCECGEAYETYCEDNDIRLWDAWVCEDCREARRRVDAYFALSCALEDLGWDLDGSSSRSEAKYYQHPDRPRRIRVASHSPVYEQSAECVTVQLGGNALPDMDIVISLDEDADTIREKAEGADAKAKA